MALIIRNVVFCAFFYFIQRRYIEVNFISTRFSTAACLFLAIMTVYLFRKVASNRALWRLGYATMLMAAFMSGLIMSYISTEPFNIFRYMAETMLLCAIPFALIVGIDNQGRTFAQWKYDPVKARAYEADEELFPWFFTPALYVIGVFCVYFGVGMFI